MNQDRSTTIINSQLKKGYKQTEVGIIPEDWLVTPLGELGNFKNGINKNSEAFGHGYPFVNLMDVFGVSSISAVNLSDLIETNNIERQTYNLKEGDVLFIRSSVKPSGVGLTALIEEDLDQIVYSGFLIRFRDSGSIGKNFKQHCFYEEGFRRRLISASSVSANTNINQDNLKQLLIPLPPTKAEQEAIASTLSDIDALIESLDRLLIKKRQIKQGAMQELLRSKDGWEKKRIGDVLTISHGRSQHEVLDENGDYPILASGGQIGKAKTYLYNKPSVLIGRKGTIDNPQYMDRPFWTVDTLFYSVIHEPNNAKYLFYQFCLIPWREYNEASGVPSLNARTIESIEIMVPSSKEQIEIANILSDMDAEIESIKSKLTKTRQLKQGMMHELLTGRIRLVD